jgi:hypothetical protein
MESLMKTRHGFVTNSSSSSFIARKTGEPTGLIETREDLERAFINRYSWRDATIQDIFEEYPEMEDQFNDLLSSLEEGPILWGHVDYGDPIDDFSAIMESLGFIVEWEPI